MKRYKIRVDTHRDIQDFVKIARGFKPGSLYVEDKSGHSIDPSSLLGMLYTAEWEETYLYSIDEDEKVYSSFAEYIVG